MCEHWWGSGWVRESFESIWCKSKQERHESCTCTWSAGISVCVCVCVIVCALLVQPWVYSWLMLVVVGVMVVGDLVFFVIVTSIDSSRFYATEQRTAVGPHGHTAHNTTKVTQSQE